MSIEEPPFNWHELGREDLGDEEREGARDLRRAQIAIRTLPVRDRLAALGAQEIETFLSVAAVSALVPANALPAVARWPELLSLAGDRQLVATAESAYGGLEAKAGMKINAFETAGVDASTGARAGTSQRIRIGIFERLAVNTVHKGFDDCVSPPPFCFPFNRFVAKYDCFTGAPCASWAPAYTAGMNDHATQVAKVIDGYMPGAQRTRIAKAVSSRAGEPRSTFTE